MATKKKLYIDTGHYQKKQGAVGFRSEVDWVRSIKPHFMAAVDKDLYDIVEVPDTYGIFYDGDNNTNIIQRIKFINKTAKVTDVLISLHADASPKAATRGVKACYSALFPAVKSEAIELSKCVAYSSGMPLSLDGFYPDSNSRYKQLGMVRETTPFALLAELGFVTNEADMACSVVSIGNGLANYVNNLADPTKYPLNFTQENNIEPMPNTQQPVTVPVQPEKIDARSITWPAISLDEELIESINAVKNFKVNDKSLIGLVDLPVLGQPMTRADEIRVFSRVATVLNFLMDSHSKDARQQLDTIKLQQDQINNLNNTLQRLQDQVAQMGAAITNLQTSTK